MRAQLGFGARVAVLGWHAVEGESGPHGVLVIGGGGISALGRRQEGLHFPDLAIWCRAQCGLQELRLPQLRER